MKLLVLGGTVFVGRHVVAAALAAGHAVTIFHRGVSRTDAIDRVESLYGDRDHDVSALQGRRFDAVIDCSGYTPAQLKRTGEALAAHVANYLFISSRSVYRCFAPGVDFDESAAVLDGDDGYGPSKARSEEAIAAALPGHVTIVRPGLIVGPHDPTGRFTYWPLRLRRGGDVLAPGRPERTVRFIDARDLALWSVALAARPPSGIYNVTGASMTMAALLAAIHREVGGDVRLHWIDDATLLQNAVVPWTELPLWLPDSDLAFGGLMDGSDDRAVAAGLKRRPIAETIRDTLAWALGPDAATPHAVATMTAQYEQSLLMTQAAAAPDGAP
ncbi:MAG: NAD-dependent epimerase/dehydratase family protein [Burkholderiaceae bacterium]